MAEAIRSAIGRWNFVFLGNSQPSRLRFDVVGPFFPGLAKVSSLERVAQDSCDIDSIMGLVLGLQRFCRQTRVHPNLSVCTDATFNSV